MTHAQQLHERTKELNCLYRVSQAVGASSQSLEAVFQDVARNIPHGWRYPESTVARIVVSEQVYCSHDAYPARANNEVLREPLVVRGEAVGEVQVRYVTSAQTSARSPFLPEEAFLLRAIASLITQLVERRQLESEIALLVDAQQELAEQVLSGFIPIWSAIEPEQGVYNEAYLDEVETRLDWFAAQGIHVMLDMHQDVYSSRFCCDGAPDWAIHAPWEDYVVNMSVWSFNYFSPEVKQAFDAFWSYAGEHQVLQDHYVAMWRHVAARFKDHPAVLGYDVMNEPHQGSGFDVIALTLRRDPTPESSMGVFEAGPFAQFYQRVIDGIRQEDRDRYIFVEPSYGIPGDGGPSFLPMLADPRSGTPKIAYAPHLYSFRLEAAEAYAEADGVFPRWRANREADSIRMEMPMLIGEWGLSMDFPGSERFVDELLTLADDMLVGWAHWSWDPNGSWSMWNVGPDGPGRWEERPLMDRLVRTYPMRVAGEPTALSFDPESAEMRLTYTTRREAHGETEIFVPARHYPDGHEVVVSAPEGSYSVREDDNRQRIYVLVSEPGEHEIVVRRAAR